MNNSINNHEIICMEGWIRQCYQNKLARLVRLTANVGEYWNLTRLWLEIELTGRKAMHLNFRETVGTIRLQVLLSRILIENAQKYHFSLSRVNLHYVAKDFRISLKRSVISGELRNVVIIHRSNSEHFFSYQTYSFPETRFLIANS